MARQVLFPLEDLPRGELRSVEVGRTRIAVMHLPDGRLTALRDVCPHQAARLSLGQIVGKVSADAIGAIELSESEFVLRCPWHGIEFDVFDGRCPADPRRTRVKAYEVEVEDGQVVLVR